MRTSFVVQYNNSQGDLVYESEPMDSYAEAENLQLDGPPDDRLDVSYATIEKRVYYSKE